MDAIGTAFTLKSGVKINTSTIGGELVAAAVGGLPFRWDDARVYFDDPSVTASQKTIIMQVFNNHIGLP